MHELATVTFTVAAMASDSGGFNVFQSVVGICGSLISIFGLIGLLRYRAHLPEVRLMILDQLLLEMAEDGAPWMDPVMVEDLQQLSALLALVPGMCHHTEGVGLCTELACRSTITKMKVIWPWIHGASGRPLCVVSLIRSIVTSRNGNIFERVRSEHGQVPRRLRNILMSSNCLHIRSDLAIFHSKHSLEDLKCPYHLFLLATLDHRLVHAMSRFEVWQAVTRLYTRRRRQRLFPHQTISEFQVV